MKAPKQTKIFNETRVVVQTKQQDGFLDLLSIENNFIFHELINFEKSPL